MFSVSKQAIHLRLLHQELTLVLQYPSVNQHIVASTTSQRLQKRNDENIKFLKNKFNHSRTISNPVAFLTPDDSILKFCPEFFIVSVFISVGGALMVVLVLFIILFLIVCIVLFIIVFLRLFIYNILFIIDI